MTAITASKYAFQYVGSPRSEAAQLRSLDFDGPLEVAQDHMLAVLLPDALEDAATAGTKTITTHFMRGGLMEGYLLDADVRKGGMHFSIKLSRSATLIKDLDEGGMDWTPIHGEADVAIPAAIVRIVAIMVTWPQAKRMIANGDVIYDGNWDNAATDTWYDWMAPDLLISSGGGMPAVGQFMNLTPGCYHDSAGHDGGRQSQEFLNLLEHIPGAIGRDISGLPHQAQAAAIAKWVRQTMRPANYTQYVGAKEAITEIERRAGSTPAERFEELFRVEWRKAHKSLSHLWPHEVQDVVSQTAALAIKLNVGDTSDGLTPYLVEALCDCLKPLMAFAVSPSNAGRATEVVRAHKDGDKSPEGEQLSAEAKQELQENSRSGRG